MQSSLSQYHSQSGIQKLVLNYFLPHYLMDAGLSVQCSLLRYDTIAEFSVDSKAEYTASSSTRSQKLKQTAVSL